MKFIAKDSLTSCMRLLALLSSCSFFSGSIEPFDCEWKGYCVKLCFKTKIQRRIIVWEATSSTTDKKLFDINHLVLPRLVVKCKHNPFVFNPGPFLVSEDGSKQKTSDSQFRDYQNFFPTWQHSACSFWSSQLAFDSTCSQLVDALLFRPIVSRSRGLPFNTP